MSHTPVPRKSSQALDFKSATLYAIRVVLHTSNTADLLQALAQRMKEAGAFFEHEPVVIDASRIEGEIHWAELLNALREHKLHPVGVIADGELQAAAMAAGLPVVDVGSAPVRPKSAPALDTEVPAAATIPEKPASDDASPTPSSGERLSRGTRNGTTDTETQEAAQAPAAPARPSNEFAASPPPAAMVINRPLRSGQRVYARNTDLIVIGVVSRGAEVIADGNIHVYGPLRGKAMAGARGDTSARIFTTQLDPELVAIAGVYRVVETSLDAQLQNRPAIISLHGESLQFESLNN